MHVVAPEIPRQHLLKLFAEASDAVRLKLEAADRRKANVVRDHGGPGVESDSDRGARPFRSITRRRVPMFCHCTCGQLTRDQLETFAQAGKFDETTIALSIMCDLSIGLIERAMVRDQSEQIVVLAKAIGLSWDTTKALLLMQAGAKDGSVNEADQWLAKFNKLQPETAKKTVQFYRLCERTGVARERPN